MRSRSLSLPARVGAIAVFLVLAGLVAMHGLGAHGTSGDEQAVSAHASGHSTLAAHATGPVMAMEPPQASTSLLAPDAPAMPGMDHAGAMCVVVLTMLLVALVLAPTGGWRRTPLRVPDSLLRLRRRARAPDRPDLVKLSVCRC